MNIVKIKKEDFISDYESMTVEQIKNKYSLNNGSYYKIVKSLNLKAKRDNSGHKKIVLI